MQEEHTYEGAYDNRSAQEKLQDFSMEEIASGAPEVNWVEKKSPLSYSVRNQNGSGSCVAQTVAKMLEVADYRNDKQTTVYSATPIYQNRSNKPTPGMNYVDAFGYPIKNGTKLESEVPSQLMSDQAMDTEANDGSLAPAKPMNYVTIPTDFEYVANAVQKYGCAMIWFKCSYAEWCRDVPEGSSDSEAVRHSVTAVDCMLWKGKKYIIIEDSWGTWQNASDLPLHEGQRAITEEFFNKHCFFAGAFLTFTFEGQQTAKPVYRWKELMKYGDENEDVRMLQKALQYLGFFPSNQECTGKFLAITARSLRDFQVSNDILDYKNEKDVTKIRAYTKTIKRLNELFAPQTTMSSTRSVTQTSNLFAFAGVITIVINSLLKGHGVEVSETDVVSVIGAVVTIVSIATNYWNRHKQGDVTLTGARKG